MSVVALVAMFGLGMTTTPLIVMAIIHLYTWLDCSKRELRLSDDYDAFEDESLLREIETQIKFDRRHALLYVACKLAGVPMPRHDLAVNGK